MKRIANEFNLPVSKIVDWSSVSGILCGLAGVSVSGWINAQLENIHTRRLAEECLTRSIQMRDEESKMWTELAEFLSS